MSTVKSCFRKEAVLKVSKDVHFVRFNGLTCNRIMIRSCLLYIAGKLRMQSLSTQVLAFVMQWGMFGLHRGPLNEDVFAAPNYTEDRILHPSVQEITEQIYRLLLQVQHVLLNFSNFKFPLKKWVFIFM